MFPDVLRGLWKANTDLKWAKYKIAKKINSLSFHQKCGGKVATEKMTGNKKTMRCKSSDLFLYEGNTSI